MHARARGFALVLALGAILLLTFLGLTVAAATSVELTAATNYRWQQQAFYVAESGLAAGRGVLRTASWNLVLPPPRTTPWSFHTPPDAPPGALSTRATRNFERGECDTWGNGVGLGAVLDDLGAAPYEYIRTIYGERLTGGFTLWVRRPLIGSAAGYIDDPSDSRLVLTAEGRAPSGAPGNATTAVSRSDATVFVEATLERVPSAAGWDIRVTAERNRSSVCN